VRCDRGRRLAGESRMNFVSLVTHGLSALFANQEVVGTRLLLMNMLTAGSFFLLIGTMVGVKFFTHLTIPVWVAVTSGLLFLLLGQFLVGCFMLVFSIMMTRSHLGFLPIRDYSYFVAEETTLYSASRSTRSATVSAAGDS